MIYYQHKHTSAVISEKEFNTLNWNCQQLYTSFEAIEEGNAENVTTEELPNLTKTEKLPKEVKVKTSKKK